MSKLEEMGTILMHIALQYTHPDFESMYSDWSTVHDIGEKLVKMSDQPQLNENQQMMSEAGLIGVIYSQLLEEFGFGYIEKDLWMIAENLSEKIANDQPQLNENQQIVLEWLKGSYVQGYGAAVIRTIHLLQKENTVDITDSSYVRGAYRALNTVEEAVVVKMFADWASEQGED